MQVSAEVEARFWAKVDRSGGPEACWPWMASRDPNGYGAFNVNGKKVGAHRVALAIKLGRSVSGLSTHSCDNRPYCNPAHLNEGTYKTNMQECKERGRLSIPPGDNHPPARKLSAVQVTEIRSLKRIGYSNRALGERFGVAHTTIGNIDRGIHWKSKT